MSHMEITVIGYVGREPELRYTQTGKSVANFTVAVNEGTGDEQKTTWIEATCWNGLAEMVSKHLKKGQLVLVQGRPQAKAWTDTTGTLRSSLVVNVNEFKFLGAKPE